MEKLYLAGGLFNAGERLHNLYLEKHLKSLGYEIILPQREALTHFDGQFFNVSEIVESCRKICADPEVAYVGNADGPDTDSGTCVEYGIAITATGKAIVYRTDFRTDLTKELGVNAMLNARGTTFIYDPCFFTELDQVEPYYRALAMRIHIALMESYDQA
ncbi:MAG: nucleoside 2-deoxyribosyltransferase [Parcubacteria group bacterium]|jgi:nucleoside 2-deoxyribosyltransferase